MTPKNKDSLLGEYPEFFSQDGEPFVFWCGDGWYSIIWNLFADLKRLEIPNLKVVEVKEKFGFLKVHFNYQEIQNLAEGLKIELDRFKEWAVKQSGRTCELCGTRGRVCKIKQRVQALCGSCFAERL